MSFQISSPPSINPASPQTIAAEGGNRLGRCENWGAKRDVLTYKTWLMPGKLAWGRHVLNDVYYHKGFEVAGMGRSLRVLLGDSDGRITAMEN